ncbi:ABC transporter substrate-binding protein [Desulfatitalea tepidiphila]|uniref:ABC transporter substrate-binding protein n=1 Tax=Desulfatitalea tepidiphila TaxID=1185843 RepID=UPI0006B55BB1|nr:ABC transporter substrate-binding protein [Desulfatitalea tepidiphila]
MKKMRKFSVGLGLGILALAILCSGAYAKDVVIGFTGPLSGPGAGYGRDNLNGLLMAADDINKAGGLTIKGKKYKVKIESYDDMIDPTAAVNNARRLAARSGAVVIFNPVFNTIAPLMQINEQPGSEFLMMAYSSTPKIEEIPNKLASSIPPPFTAYVQAFADTAWQMGWRKGAMMVTLGAYGDEWREAWKHHWTEKGGEILADKPANYYTETDFSAQLSAVLATNPEYLLIGGPSEPTGLVIEQARNLGFKGGFVLVDQAKMDYVADVVFKGDLSKMDSVIGVCRVLDLPSPVIKKFNTEYETKYKVHNTFEAMLNYSAVHIIFAAMEKAGTIDDPRAIKAAIPSVLPQSESQVPTPYVGTLNQKLLVAATVGVIQDGAYKHAYQYIWWAKDEAAFEKAKKMLAEGIEIRWMPIKGYLQE